MSLASWLKRGTKLVSIKNKLITKTIDSVAGNSVYYGDGGWDTVNVVTASYYPADLKPNQLLPMWATLGVKVIPKNNAGGELTISSWDENTVFYTSGTRDYADGWGKIYVPVDAKALPKKKERCKICRHDNL